MKATESFLSSSRTTRDYVTNYTRALNSDVLDGANFADIEAQKAFFIGKLRDAKASHRGQLFAGRAAMASEMRTAIGDDKAALEAAIVGIDRELSTLG